MTSPSNPAVVLRARASGLPTPELFEFVEGGMPQPADGEVVVHNLYVTADPGMKGWISTARNYLSVETGATMQAIGVGEVVVSRNPDVAEGDYVIGLTGWQEYGIASPQQPVFRVVDPAAGPLSASLGVLGLSGLTAYFGLLDIGRPQAGETVLVSHRGRLRGQRRRPDRPDPWLPHGGHHGRAGEGGPLPRRLRL